MQTKDVIRFEQDSPIRRISRLSRLNMNSLAGPISAIGIARGTFPFVMEVLCREGVIQEDLSRLLSIDRAATARALKRLERDGLIERREDPADRRGKHVFPTDRTRDLCGDILGILTQQKEALFNGFDEGERALFLRMLDRVIDNMGAPTSP
ncbi:regulatory protein MarR [Pseudodesulfovibrio mercurii]|uniref:Regulatory protein MarR n=1 Tax=Pseudodesulfovibrio mercurii TaxID=641491 RepID=F0JEJ0_9BACT|nr:MarR family transcriptional regulator [Pseudodesulfovibrio mercurii]EGB14719.1 regulatory protein MarR [Pseudodesulfovibrio mercurii]